MTNSATSFYSTKNILSAALVTVLYLVVSYLLIGFKTDQLVLAAIFNGMYFLSSGTRKFILGFSIFIVYWIIFDYMKAFPNYQFGKVHIQDLYDAEKSLFGISYSDDIITPNEYWLAHHNTFLDILTGIFYLCWIPVPLAFATYLFYKDKQLFLQFSLTFVVVNFVGFIIYYTYPAAPPWYIQQHGNNFIPGTPGNTAGLVRFDNFFGVSIFKGLYAKGSNVFAAMPSLHSSYPLIVFYYGCKRRVGWLMSSLFALVTIGIWFAAVYNSHHYVLDVVAGILTAVAGIVIFNILKARNKPFQATLDSFSRYI